MRLSIVATLYQSANHLQEFHARCSSVAQAHAGDDYEIVLVNDGSPDDSLGRAIRLTETDPHVVLVDLSRNFGHHKAMMTGLAHARGDEVFLIDSDLEEPPECLLTFSEQMHGENCDVVFGVQEQRKGSWFERLSGGLFWTLINRLSGLSLPANVVTARLMTRRYVDALLCHEEREVFMAGLFHITGFVQKAVTIQKLSTSQSTYTFRRKLSLVVNSVTSFSVLPLVAIFYIGLIIFSFACCYSAYLLINWLFFSYIMAGWTSVMVSIWLLGGLVLSCMGIIGIYLSKVFSESKRRPYTIVRNIYGRS
ncbi:putative glycosyltransferase [Pseudomonas sp. 478]|uniref:glycosyltransferase family 2 protein n=1 Tax=unclassified Pseudomonas TaxID=196821 RepID=UPI000DACE72C|nr:MULTISPECIES: glycosyltransferase family 2 protein [unclassified Pseudomonas]PZW94593.1 putative glycosyltransferase [Pseudomonas sp. 478]TCV38496.1 putative glycosyltransferase [Pseudomonas sp. 460]